MRLKDWLKDRGRVYSRRDLDYLLKVVFSKNKASLLCDNPLLAEKRIELEEITREYLLGKPLSYILRQEDFFGYTFFVDERVLIPRPETEILVEKAIDLIKTYQLSSVLDLGCGCGNIGIVIDKILGERNVKVFVSDISFDALNVCRINKERHFSEVMMVNTNLLDAFKEEVFDLIIANPPYIDRAYWESNNFLHYEPEIALVSEDKGMGMIKKIIRLAHLYLNHQGYLIIEINENCKADIERFILDCNRYIILDWIRDYNNLWRGIILRKKMA